MVCTLGFGLCRATVLNSLCSFAPPRHDIIGMHIYLVISDAMLSSAVNSLWESLPPFSVSFRIHIKVEKTKTYLHTWTKCGDLAGKGPRII